MLDVSEEEGKDRARKPYLKYSYAFNLSQTSLYNNEQPKPTLVQAEELISQMKNIPLIKNNYRRCTYNLIDDVISIPVIQDFDCPEEYYSGLFHEIIHSTGHPSRLNRISINDDKIKYSVEELVAELGSSYLCGLCGISNSVIENQAAYLEGWLSKISSDKNIVVRASLHAKRAVEYLIDDRFFK